MSQMKQLTLQDTAALLYTGLGSQREIARRLGISHQRIGKILRSGQEGGYALKSRALKNPQTISLFTQALALHTHAAAAVAASQMLPFDRSIPVLATRMPFTEPQRAGILGDRVEAKHMHWLSDSLRNAWLKSMQRSGKFYSASAGSVVHMVRYNEGANQRERVRRDSGLPARTIRQGQFHKQVTKQIRVGVHQGLMHTTYTDMTKDNEIPFSYRLATLNGKLEEKHMPATGEDMPGTAFATRFLLQVDTRNGKDKAFRNRHPIPKLQPGNQAQAHSAVTQKPGRGQKSPIGSRKKK